MIAVEVGFSAVKVKDGKSTFSFPSAIVEEGGGSMSFGKASPGIYEYEGRKVLVGGRALASAEQYYRLDVEWLIESTPILVYHALTIAHRHNEDTLVVGLPPEYFLDNQARLSQRLSSFRVDGGLCGFKRVYVVPQGVGSFYDYCCSCLTPPADEEISLLIDVGANTVNSMLAFGEEVCPEKSIQFTRCGACLAANEVAACLRRSDITISQAQAHKALRSGIHNGERIMNLPDILSRFARHTFDKVYNHYANYTLDRVILTGGGAALIKDYIPSEHRFSQKLCYVDEPVYSNVRGYYLAGLSHAVEHNL